MQAVLLATNNPHKTREIREILGERFMVEALRALPGVPPVEETGATLHANAELKARAVARPRGEWVLADDSGLEVDALDGAPGVRSARFAGESATDAGNTARLLECLRGVPAAARTARFRCVLALVGSGPSTRFFEGAVEGAILDAPRGVGGFGYDPVFVPAGHTRSFAEMSPAEKNALSHRGRALEALAAWASGMLR